MTATNELTIQAEQDAVVIGAGAAGLATAAELQRRGVHAPVLERGDHVGQSWHDRYRVLRLNTGRPFSALRGLRYERGTPMFPTRDQVIDYLDTYRDRQHLQVVTGTHATRIDPATSGWTVHTTRGSITAGQVAVATGLYAEPDLPAPLSQPVTDIPVTHSRYYVDPEPYRDRTVLVVGAGSSGMEIAHDLVRGGAARVLLSVRTPPTILPRSIAGKPGDPAVHLLIHLPTRLADAQVRLLQRLTIGDLSAHGLPVPDVGPFTQMRHNPLAGGPAFVDAQVIDDLRARRITVVPAVTGVGPGTVNLDDGSHVCVDAVIAAAGFRPGLEPLVGHLGVLDKHGIPVAHDQHPARPGLHFVNYRNPPRLDLARRRAPRTARAIAREHHTSQRSAAQQERRNSLEARKTGAQSAGETMTLSDGRTLGYVQCGAPHGEPVLAFHGIPSSRLESRLFHEAALDRGVKIIGLDRPGIGLSDYQPGRRLLDWPDDVVEFADRMGIDRFAVVGGSGGVPATLACAYKIPHRLTSVAVLCGPRPLGEPGATEGWSRARRLQSILGRRSPLWIPELAMRAVARAVWRDPDTAPHRIFGELPEPDRAALERPELNQHYVDSIREAFRTGPRGAALEYVLVKRPWDFALEDIPITVHLWHGEQDTLLPAAMGRYLARTIPDCRATIVPNEGHFSLLSGYVDDVLTVLVPASGVPDLPSSAHDPTPRVPTGSQSRC